MNPQQEFRHFLAENSWMLLGRSRCSEREAGWSDQNRFWLAESALSKVVGWNSLGWWGWRNCWSWVAADRLSEYRFRILFIMTSSCFLWRHKAKITWCWNWLNWSKKLTGCVGVVGRVGEKLCWLADAFRCFWSNWLVYKNFEKIFLEEFLPVKI